MRSRRTQRAFLGTTVCRVSRFLTLVSKFPSWPQFRLVITGVLKIPVMLVSIHLSYNPGRICSKAVRRWLITHASIPHLGQATRAPGMVSAIPHLSRARVLGTVKGRLIAKPIVQSLDGNSWDHQAVRGGGWGSHTTAHISGDSTGSFFVTICKKTWFWLQRTRCNMLDEQKWIE